MLRATAYDTVDKRRLTEERSVNIGSSVSISCAARTAQQARFFKQKEGRRREQTVVCVNMRMQDGELCIAEVARAVVRQVSDGAYSA